VSRSCLYLVSSSANREYVVDCLEALALPRGLVQHFRYRRPYVDEALWNGLPDEPGRTPDELADCPVVVLYLFQEQSSGAWRTSSPYLPVRCGRLVEAFRDGKVAHFYFTVTDYIMQAADRREARLIPGDTKFKTSSAPDARDSYAHLDRDLEIAAPPSYGDTLAFQDFVDFASKATQWRTRSLGSAPLDVTYALMFFRVASVLYEQGGRWTELEPRLRRLPGHPVAEYELRPLQTYYVKIITYLFFPLPAQFPGQGTATLNLGFDQRIFQSSGRASFPISSSYDLEHLAFQPLSVTDERRAVLRIECRHGTPTDRENFVRREVLAAEVLLPAVVRPEDDRPRPSMAQRRGGREGSAGRASGGPR